MKPKVKPTKVLDQELEEWDPREGMGILPEGIALTQNVGCVGKPKDKKTIPPMNFNDNK